MALNTLPHQLSVMDRTETTSSYSTVLYSDHFLKKQRKTPIEEEVGRLHKASSFEMLEVLYLDSLLVRAFLDLALMSHLNDTTCHLAKRPG